MTMTDAHPLSIVWHACTPKNHIACLEAGAVVTERQPSATNADFTVLYELHVPRSVLTEKKGELRIAWDEAVRWPQQVRAL